MERGERVFWFQKHGGTEEKGELNLAWKLLKGVSLEIFVYQRMNVSNECAYIHTYIPTHMYT
jgi:hypothetical protein